MENELKSSEIDLTKSLKQIPKNQRRESLDKIKESEDYWLQRTDKIKLRQNEKPINDGLGVFVKTKTLYHGSATEGIKKFNHAEDTTVGLGVYFTSEAKDAIGYAKGRSRGEKNNSPIIYEAIIQNMSLLDLRKSENVKKIMAGFKQKIIEKLKDPTLKWYHVETAHRGIEAIDKGIAVGDIKNAVSGTQDIFTSYIRELGYDGLVTLEGGEGGYVGNHDSYLVFNPEKIKITKEHKVI